MIQSIGEILELFVLQDWQTFRSCVLSNPVLLRNVASAVSACSQLNGMTLLHAAVRYNPPLDIVTQMMELCPQMTAAKDCLDRTPLHVAIGSGVSPEVVKLIAHAHPSACDVQDAEGKTPLHLACDSSCVLFEDHDDFNDDDATTASRQPPCHETVEVLLAYSLRAAILQDAEGKSPLQHAVASNASSNTVSLLQSSAAVIRRNESSPVQQERRHSSARGTRRISL